MLMGCTPLKVHMAESKPPRMLLTEVFSLWSMAISHDYSHHGGMYILSSSKHLWGIYFTYCKPIHYLYPLLEQSAVNQKYYVLKDSPV